MTSNHLPIVLTWSGLSAIVLLAALFGAPAAATLILFCAISVGLFLTLQFKHK